mgnify:CR=1 FL=1
MVPITYKSSIYQANNLVFHTKTKHIEIHYYSVKENVLTNEIDINHLKTYLQIDSMFTKLLVVKRFGKFKDLLNIRCIELENISSLI